MACLTGRPVPQVPRLALSSPQLPPSAAPQAPSFECREAVCRQGFLHMRLVTSAEVTPCSWVQAVGIRGHYC